MTTFRFIAGRVVGLIAVLWVLVTIVFVLGAIIPNDPARVYAGEGASPKVIEAKRAELGLDKPVLQQYRDYMSRLLHGDLAESVHTRQPVKQDIVAAFPATMELLIAAALLTGAIGLAVGVITTSASKGGGVARLVLLAGASVPSFCLALLLLLLLYSKLGWLPAGARISQGLNPPEGPTKLLVVDGLLAGDFNLVGDALWHLLLPALCLALAPALLAARTLRSSLIHALRQDYARTARAKGLSERQVLWRHGMRNSLNAPLTIAGLEFGAMLAGIAVIETIFAWPGLGLYIDRSIASSDFPAIAGVTLVIGFVYVVANALVDLAQAWADPRLRRIA